MSNSKPSVKPRRVVVISWGDASIETEDFTLKEAEDTIPVNRKTVGFLIVKNQHGYVLATDTYDLQPTTFNGKLFIPKDWITKIEYLT